MTDGQQGARHNGFTPAQLDVLRCQIVLYKQLKDIAKRPISAEALKGAIPPPLPSTPPPAPAAKQETPDPGGSTGGPGVQDAASPRGSNADAAMGDGPGKEEPEPAVRPTVLRAEQVRGVWCVPWGNGVGGFWVRGTGHAGASSLLFPCASGDGRRGTPCPPRLPFDAWEGKPGGGGGRCATKQASYAENPCFPPHHTTRPAACHSQVVRPARCRAEGSAVRDRGRAAAHQPQAHARPTGRGSSDERAAPAPCGVCSHASQVGVLAVFLCAMVGGGMDGGGGFE